MPPTTRAPIRSWLTRWVAPLQPGAEVEITVERTGVVGGDTVVEVTCRADGELAMVAEAVVAAPRTTYAFPGQGIQSQGMGLEARSRSAAAREVWDRADQHTREALGFSILAVVRDNPTELWADGELHRHPDGVLFLTQFTQVAMATLAVAQVAEMREAGVFVEDAITCGHSVGEYNALAAVTGILPLEALLEIVFRRGMAMHHLVPRDAQGRSNYRLAAIRPSQIDLADDDVADFVAEISERTRRVHPDRQLQPAWLAVRHRRHRRRSQGPRGRGRGAPGARRRQAGLHPGAGHRRAVPLLGAARRRRRLPRAARRAAAGDDRPVGPGRALHPQPGAAAVHPRPLATSRRSRSTSTRRSSSRPSRTGPTWEADPARLGRALLIELLAWQFASPVRWIETQDLLFGSPEHGGLGIEQFVEVGVANAPTLANLASQTTKLPSYDGVAPKIVNSSRDAAVVFATDTPMADDEPEDEADEPRPPRRPTERARRGQGCSGRRTDRRCRRRASRRPDLHRRRRDQDPGRAADQGASRPDRHRRHDRGAVRRRLLAPQPAARRPRCRALARCHRRCRRGRLEGAVGHGDQAGPHLLSRSARC